MSRYLDFVTYPITSGLRFTKGQPIHDGKIPNMSLPLRGIRVDQEPIGFADETLPERVLRALVEGSRLEKRGFVFDCLLFVALMEEAQLDTSDPYSYPYVHRLGAPAVALDAEISEPLFLVRGDPGEGTPCLDEIEYHAVYPAHATAKPQFVHKLGQTELCLSGLDAAASMYRTDTARTLSF